jgi:MinD-like ATPase involved in chromosome partitioning or flagellar assembly
MRPIVSVHSYRRGTGKSFVAANLAALLANQGLRVGIIDSNSQFPSLPYIFKLDTAEVGNSLHDYISGKCDINDAVIDATQYLGLEIKGHIFLVPANSEAERPWQILREDFDLGRLFDGLQRLIESLQLDILLIDTCAGLNDDSLPYIAGANMLIEIMRPDHQDYQGTATAILTAQKLEVSEIFLVMNQIPRVLDFDDIRKKISQAYECEVAALLPYSDDIAYMGSLGIFSLQFPDHEISRELKKLADRIRG